MPGPYFCQPYLGVPCVLGNGGHACSIPGRCKYDNRCNELRCANHSKCARNGWRAGRSRGRANARTKAKAAPAPAPAVAPAPVGRMPELACEVLTVDAWYSELLASVNVAREVIIGTYQFDNAALTDTFERRLRSRSEFNLVLLIDGEMYTSRVPYHQKSRLERLRRAGATVVCCRGTASTGSLHAKAMVTDRRTAYVGSANFTSKSLRNAELCLRLRGPPVREILQFLQTEQTAGTEL